MDYPEFERDKGYDDFVEEPPNMSFREIPSVRGVRMSAKKAAELVQKGYAQYVRKAKRKQHYSHHDSLTHWRDAQGKSWPIYTMTDSHLCNTIRMLGRRFNEVQRGHDFVGYDPGFAVRGPAALFPVYGALFNEAICRGLTP